MKIRWYEVLVMLVTALCVIIFLLNYFSTVTVPGVTVTTQQGGAYQYEAAGDDSGDRSDYENSGS